jgi:hypothetical protein
MQQADLWGQWHDADDEAVAIALSALASEIQAACDGHEEWPAKVGAGVYAGVGYLVEWPVRARQLLAAPRSGPMGEPFQRVVQTTSALLAEAVPRDRAQVGPIPSATMAGIWLLVGEHVRVDRHDRLRALCPDLHLMILLPFLGFAEAKRWTEATQQANRA